MRPLPRNLGAALPVLASALALALALTITLAQPRTAGAEPEILSSPKIYTVSQPGGDAVAVPAVETASAAASFYSYSSASSHTGFELAYRSLLFLHRDIRPGYGDVSLIITHGIDSDINPPVTQPSAHVYMDLAGLPTTTRVTASDDGGEFTKPSSTTGRGRWAFGNNTDGGVMSYFPTDSSWEFTLTSSNWSGLNTWQYYFANGDNLELNRSLPLTVKYTAAETPDAVATEEGVETTVCTYARDVVYSGGTLTYTFAWNSVEEPTATTTIAEAESTLVCATYTYRHFVTTAVDVVVTNEAGETDTASFTMEVGNVEPTITPGGPFFADEGGTVLLNVGIYDPGTAATQLLRWDTDGDGVWDTDWGTEQVLPTEYTDDFSGNARVEIDDGAGENQIADLSVTVANVAPTIAGEPPATLADRERLTASFSAVDPGTDTHVWSLPIAPAGMAIDPDTGALEWMPTTAQSAIIEHAWTVRVVDDDGGEATQAFSVSLDPDGDEHANGVDNCPAVANPLQEDLDRDGVGDSCDSDRDGDNVANDDDNCPDAANPLQNDLDGDLIGDECDGDIDADGAANGDDCDPYDPTNFPGAFERCDNVDNDCDGEIDGAAAAADCPGSRECQLNATCEFPFLRYGPSDYDHVVEGAFTGWSAMTLPPRYEWWDIPGLPGLHTDGYFDFDGQNLWIMNDWHVESSGAPARSLIQLVLGRETWEFWVMGSGATRVLRNGTLLSEGAVTSFDVELAVEAGRSPAEPHELHQIVELKVPVVPGTRFVARFYGPGPDGGMIPQEGVFVGIAGSEAGGGGTAIYRNTDTAHVAYGGPGRIDGGGAMWLSGVGFEEGQTLWICDQQVEVLDWRGDTVLFEVPDTAPVIWYACDGSAEVRDADGVVLSNLYIIPEGDGWVSVPWGAGDHAPGDFWSDGFWGDGFPLSGSGGYHHVEWDGATLYYLLDFFADVMPTLGDDERIVIQLITRGGLEVWRIVFGADGIAWVTLNGDDYPLDGSQGRADGAWTTAASDLQSELLHLIVELGIDVSAGEFVLLTSTVEGDGDDPLTTWRDDVGLWGELLDGGGAIVRAWKGALLLDLDAFVVLSSDIVTVRGRGFGVEMPAGTRVTVGGAEVDVMAWSDGAIVLDLPLNLVSGLIEIHWPDGTVSNGIWLEVVDDADDDGVATHEDNCPARANPGQEDRDGDSFGDACDCEPDLPESYPGALEVCDAVDNDCDGTVDNGAADEGCAGEMLCARGGRCDFPFVTWPPSGWEHTVDGHFTGWDEYDPPAQFEWFDVPAMTGDRSFGYFDFDGASLWVLNDWRFTVGASGRPQRALVRVLVDGTSWDIWVTSTGTVRILEDGRLLSDSEAAERGFEAAVELGRSPLQPSEPHPVSELRLPIGADQRFAMQVYGPDDDGTLVPDAVVFVGHTEAGQLGVYVDVDISYAVAGSPRRLLAGDIVRVSGTGFGDDGLTEGGRVTVCGVEAEVLAWSDSSVLVRLPALDDLEVGCDGLAVVHPAIGDNGSAAGLRDSDPLPLGPADGDDGGESGWVFVAPRESEHAPGDYWDDGLWRDEAPLTTGSGYHFVQWDGARLRMLSEFFASVGDQLPDQQGDGGALVYHIVARGGLEVWTVHVDHGGAVTITLDGEPWTGAGDAVWRRGDSPLADAALLQAELELPVGGGDIVIQLEILGPGAETAPRLWLGVDALVGELFDGGGAIARATKDAILYDLDRFVVVAGDLVTVTAKGLGDAAPDGVRVLFGELSVEIGSWGPDGFTFTVPLSPVSGYIVIEWPDGRRSNPIWLRVDGDDDGDAVPRDEDNCPDIFNPEQRDRDGDTYGDECDCAPDDGDVNPDAIDICDAIDNDCDGVVDGAVADGECPLSLVCADGGVCDFPFTWWSTSPIGADLPAHVVDGAFTGWAPQGVEAWEWSVIPPLVGEQADLYADYDGSDLWLLQDWRGSASGLARGLIRVQAGDDAWEAWVMTGGRSIVLHNGELLTDERREILGVEALGEAGRSPRSPSHDHLIGELRIPVQPGERFYVQLHGPDGAGGLVADPAVFVGVAEVGRVGGYVDRDIVRIAHAGADDIRARGVLRLSGAGLGDTPGQVDVCGESATIAHWDDTGALVVLPDESPLDADGRCRGGLTVTTAGDLSSNRYPLGGGADGWVLVPWAGGVRGVTDFWNGEFWTATPPLNGDDARHFFQWDGGRLHVLIDFLAASDIFGADNLLPGQRFVLRVSADGGRERWRVTVDADGFADVTLEGAAWAPGPADPPLTAARTRAVSPLQRDDEHLVVDAALPTALGEFVAHAEIVDEAGEPVVDERAIAMGELLAGGGLTLRPERGAALLGLDVYVASPGGAVTLQGVNLGHSLPPGTTVTLGDLPLVVDAWNERGVVALIPHGQPEDGVASGFLEIRWPDGRRSNPMWLEISPEDNDGVPPEEDNCLDLYNPEQEDRDGDGFGDLCDCAPTNEDINPDALEVCDGIDNDCDGVTDGASADTGCDGERVCGYAGRCDFPFDLIEPSEYPHDADGQFDDWTPTDPPDEFEWFDVDVFEGDFGWIYLDYDGALLHVLLDWHAGVAPLDGGGYAVFRLATLEGQRQWLILVHADGQVRALANGWPYEAEEAAGGYSFTLSPGLPDVEHGVFELTFPLDSGRFSLSVGAPADSNALVQEPRLIHGVAHDGGGVEAYANVSTAAVSATARAAAAPGTPVTLQGVGFGEAPGELTVCDEPVAPLAWSDRSVTFLLPDDLYIPPPSPSGDPQIPPAGVCREGAVVHTAAGGASDAFRLGLLDPGHALGVVFTPWQSADATAPTTIAIDGAVGGWTPDMPYGTDAEWFGSGFAVAGPVQMATRWDGATLTLLGVADPDALAPLDGTTFALELFTGDGIDVWNVLATPSADETGVGGGESERFAIPTPDGLAFAWSETSTPFGDSFGAEPLVFEVQVEAAPGRWGLRTLHVDADGARVPVGMTIGGDLLATGGALTGGSAAPALWSLSPYFAPEGEWVLVEGSDLGAQPIGATVYLGSAEVLAAEWTDSGFRLQVPNGAASGLVRVEWVDGQTTNGLWLDTGIDPTDWDGDGVADAVDNCPTIANPGQENSDDDPMGDACDADRDGDGRANLLDNCPDVPNPDQDDVDGDGVGDLCDDDEPDADQDDVPDHRDNCPSVDNHDQEDRDRDGLGDACDDDRDGDEVDNDIDNCPDGRNPEQEDQDEDGRGDVCDPDRDGDMIANDDDNCPDTFNPTQADVCSGSTADEDTGADVSGGAADVGPTVTRGASSGCAVASISERGGGGHGAGGLGGALALLLALLSLAVARRLGGSRQRLAPGRPTAQP